MLPLLLIGPVASAKQPRIEVFSGNVVSMDLDLSSGVLPARGTITQRLSRGIIDSTGAECWFVISDASDKDFAEDFGAIRADALEDVPDSAVDVVHFDAASGMWHFPEDAGLTVRLAAGGKALPPVANPRYSPLKRFVWNSCDDSETVTANMPLVVWGTAAGQSLVTDQGGCDPLIRVNPPSPFHVGGGPKAGASESPLQRYKGGQALDIDLAAQTVTMKLHRGVFAPGNHPYYTVFEANKGPAAGFMGVPHAPKLSNLGRFGDGTGTGLVVQFGNGVPVSDGGPARFQQGLANYPGGQQRQYSPMWVVWWAYFTNGTPVEDMFRADRNVGEGATPAPGSGIPGFDPKVPTEFDPFQIEYKGADLTEFARSVTGNDDGHVESLDDLFQLADDGHILVTEGPGGLRLGSPMQPSLIVSCPVPVKVRD